MRTQRHLSPRHTDTLGGSSTPCMGPHSLQTHVPGSVSSTPGIVRFFVRVSTSVISANELQWSVICSDILYCDFDTGLLLSLRHITREHSSSSHCAHPP